MKKMATMITMITMMMMVLFCAELKADAASPKDLVEKAAKDGYWDCVIEEDDENEYDQFLAELNEECAMQDWNFVAVPEGDLLKVYIKKNKDEDDVNKQITKMSNEVGGTNKWTVMQIGGLDKSKAELIIKEVAEDSEFFTIYGFIADNPATFSMQLKTTHYYIMKGDTLKKIAKKKRTTVEELMGLNPQIKNPDLIFAGETLRIR